MNSVRAPARRNTLDPKLDIVFWMLFSAEENRELLLSLLNAVLAPASPIVEIEVKHAQPERASIDDKSIALDLRVRLGSGEHVDIEMQSQRRPAQRERALYYWSRLYAGQLLRGRAYADLRRCVVVLITSFEELATPDFHSIFRVRERETGQLLTDQLEIHLVELPKLAGALARNDEPALTAWGKFFTAAADEDLETLAMENPLLKRAKDALDRLSADPDARSRAEQREMALISYELDMTKVRREGEAKGRLLGRGQLLAELLAEKFGELPLATRALLAEASEAQLGLWSKRLLAAESLEHVLEPP